MWKIVRYDHEEFWFGDKSNCNQIATTPKEINLFQILIIGNKYYKGCAVCNNEKIFAVKEIQYERKIQEIQDSPHCLVCSYAFDDIDNIDDLELQCMCCSTKQYSEKYNDQYIMTMIREPRKIVVC